VDVIKLKNKIRDRYLLNRYITPFVKRNRLSNQNICYKNSLAIIAHPRGGSTWMGELMMNIPDSVLIDEPLWRGKLSSSNSKPKSGEGKIDAIDKLGFYYNQPIPVSESWPEAKIEFEKILTGKVSSLNIYRENNFQSLKSSNYFITKFCYAHLLLKWLLQNFQLNAILLTRHPCAVVSSQLTHPAWKNLRINKPLKFPNFLHDELYKELEIRIPNLATKEEFLAAIWALGIKETIYSNYNDLNWITVAYENLVINFKFEINRIFKRLNIKVPDSIWQYQYKPSGSSSGKSITDIREGNLINSWKRELSEIEITRIMKIVEKFEIDVYSTSDEPNYKILYKDQY